MNKDNAKDYLPLVQALAEGKTIQFFYCEWEDCCTSIDFVYPPTSYRIKPEPKKQWYRLVLLKDKCNGIFYTWAIEDEDDELETKKDPRFVRWLTDRIEYELPEENIASASKCNHQPMLIYSPQTEEQLKRPLCRRCGKKIVFNGRDWVEYELPEGDA